MDHRNDESTACASIKAGLKQLQLPSHPGIVTPLFQLATLIHDFNRSMNLIGQASVDTIITRHLLDSLAISPWLQGRQIADIGTGAGLPGMPLAIIHPDKQFHLIDSRQKRCEFVRHVCHQLNIKNVEIICSRAEQYQPGRIFDTLVCRALSELKSFIQITAHLVHDTSILLAMKSTLSDAEHDAGVLALRQIENQGLCRENTVPTRGSLAETTAETTEKTTRAHKGGAATAQAEMTQADMTGATQKRIRIVSLQIPGLNEPRQAVIVDPRLDRHP